MDVIEADGIVGETVFYLRALAALASDPGRSTDPGMWLLGVSILANKAREAALNAYGDHLYVPGTLTRQPPDEVKALVGAAVSAAFGAEVKPWG